MGQPATPDEVAAVIAFLDSDDASFVNGVILPVDGSLAASNGQPNFLVLVAELIGDVAHRLGGIRVVQLGELAILKFDRQRRKRVETSS